MITKRPDPRKWLLALSTIAVLIPLLFVFWLRTLTLYGTWGALSFATVAFIGAWYVAFLFGLFVPAGRSHARGIPHPGLWVCLLSLAAVVGAAIMTYEFAIVRGFGFSTSINDLRIMQVNQAAAGFVGSWLGGLGRSCVSAVVVAWILACLEWRQIRVVPIVALILSTAAVFVYQAKFEGGRFFISGLAIAALYACILGAALAQYRNKDGASILRIFMSNLAPFAIVSTMFIAINIYNVSVSMSRNDYVIDHSQQNETDIGNDVDISHKIFDRADLSPYAKYYARYASSFDIDLNSLPYAIDFDRIDLSKAMAWIYFTQGLNEFNGILKLKNMNHAYGFFQFSQLAQLASLIWGKDFRYDISGNLPNVGTYTTLPGSFYVDFGMILGVALPFLLGAALRRGLWTIADGAVSGWTIAAPLIVMIVAIGAATSTFTNFWTCFVWIGIVGVGSRTMEYKSLTRF